MIYMAGVIVNEAFTIDKTSSLITYSSCIKSPLCNFHMDDDDYTGMTDSHARQISDIVSNILYSILKCFKK